MAEAGITTFGDWDKLKRIVEKAPEKLEKALQQSLKQEAQFFRNKIVEGIREQAPGGKPFKPLSEKTLAMREARGFKGTKALIVRGDLRNSVTVAQQGDGVFVGVLRTAKSKDGKDLYNVAAIHEYGAGPFVIRWTEKARAYVMAKLRESGQKITRRKHPVPGSIVVVKIPARPFIRPVWDAFAKPPEQVADRFMRRLARNLHGDFGSLFGGEPPTR